MAGLFNADELRRGGAFMGYTSAGFRPEAPIAAVIPVPYDRTSTWQKGADQGPRALIEASAAVEEYDIQTQTNPVRQGIATLTDVVCDQGPEQLAELVQERVGRVMDAGVMPLVLGGEHSVTIGAVRAAAERSEDLTVLQIDAHTDLREEYEGSPCNHACVMARAREVAKIVQVGIRAIDAGELEGMDRSRVFWAHEIVDAPDESWMDGVCALLTRNVYITIDVDGLDPSVMAATGTPEPGGLTWGQVNRLLAKVCARSRVVGADVVELCPRPSLHACDFLAAKLAYRVVAMARAALS
ncbi:MAG: agmatinase [Phycisphaerales bacterium]